jgi:hypothetical protein
MTRIAVISALFFVAACDVGDVTMGMGGDANNATGCINMGTPLTPHTHAAPVGASASNQGQNCLQANCHNPTPGLSGPGATPYTFAGTAYTVKGGTTGVGGVSIRLKSSSGVVVVSTDSDGNFYSTGAVTFPATADITSCPTDTPMLTQLQTGNGACNGTGCHTTGGNPGPMGLQ